MTLTFIQRKWARVSLLRAIRSAAFACTATACGLPTLKPVEHRYFTIPSVEPVGHADRTFPLTLLVRDATGEGFLNSQRILFSADRIEQGYYQSASWVEPPTVRFTTLLTDALTSYGLFRTVVRSTSSVVGELLLTSEIRRFEHLAMAPPGSVAVTVRAQLIDLRTRTVIAQRDFERTAAVADYSSRGAADAFAVATGEVVKEMLSWIERSAANLPPLVW